MSKIFFIRCITFSLSHFPMSNKFCGSYDGVENYLSNIICWQTCQTLLSICRKHSVAHHKACRTFSVEHFDVENLPWSIGKRIVEHFLSKIVCFPRLVWWSTPYHRWLKSPVGQILPWPRGEKGPLPTLKKSQGTSKIFSKIFSNHTDMTLLYLIFWLIRWKS